MLTEILVAAALLGSGPPVTQGDAPIASAATPTQLAIDAAPGAAGAPVADRRSSRIIGDDALKASRGGETQLISTQTLAAIINGNVIGGDYTAGSVTLSDNALSSFNGVGNLLINTGAQNSLQSGMSIVINVAP